MMATARKCAFCGGAIPPERGHKTLYCSDICRAKSKREQREAMREAAKKPMKRICPECGEMFHASSGGKIFCSDKCRAARRKRIIDGMGDSGERYCQHCGSLMNGAHRAALYCSKECRDEAKRERAREYEACKRRGEEPPKVMQVCRTCGAEFEVRPGIARLYCSPICRNRAQNESTRPDAWKKEAAERKMLLDRPCEWCGKMFTPFSRKNRFCSKACLNRDPAAKKSTGPDWVAIQNKCLALHMSYGEAVQRGLLDDKEG